MSKTKKERIPMGVRQEFDDVDYWKQLKKSTETVKLPNGEVISVYDYMKKFMQESYGNGFSRKEPESNILQTEDQKKWARRNNNNTNRDSFNVARKYNGLETKEYLIDRKKNDKKESWEEEFTRGSYETALQEILTMVEIDLNIKLNEPKRKALLNFYFRIKKLVSYIRKDLKNEK